MDHLQARWTWIASVFWVIFFLGACQTAPKRVFEIETNELNPWTHLNFNDDNFQFAIVGDRAGGTRFGIFKSAIPKINAMQPEFVMSVGDLTASEHFPSSQFSLEEQLEGRWNEFDSMVDRLEMPFFYVGGNADMVHYTSDGAELGNMSRSDKWKARMGRTYYHFVYKNVLLIALNTDDPPISHTGMISDDQIEWLRQVLKDNQNVRWTIIFQHRPLWEDAPQLWQKVEAVLGDRRRTVFAGHHHTYQKAFVNGQIYYKLATTGGASDLRGLEAGEFDHISWVTMKKDGPHVANLLLDGIYADDPKAVEQSN